MGAKHIPGIPDQTDGAFHDTESRKNYQVPGSAARDFQILKDRFFAINYWQDYCGKGSAEFKVFDSDGAFVSRIPKKGDHIRIDIPGPGDFENKGYDWVVITEVSDQYQQDYELESYTIVSYPSSSPKAGDGKIAHFYSSSSSSSFRIALGVDFISVGIYGRNEKPNFYKKNLLNKIRSFLISFGGFARFTKIEWKCVADSLLDF